MDPKTGASFTTLMRRPLAIACVAWLFIVVGAAGLLRDWWPLLTSQAAQQLAKLQADGLADLGPAWTSRLVAIIGGAGLLRGRNWARWVLVAWMAFHIGLSVLHTWLELLEHSVIFAPILYVLFRGQSSRYLQQGKT